MITGGCKYKILAHAQVVPQRGGAVSVFPHYTMRRSYSDVCFSVSDVTE